MRDGDSRLQFSPPEVMPPYCFKAAGAAVASRRRRIKHLRCSSLSNRNLQCGYKETCRNVLVRRNRADLFLQSWSGNTCGNSKRHPPTVFGFDHRCSLDFRRN